MIVCKKGKLLTEDARESLKDLTAEAKAEMEGAPKAIVVEKKKTTK